MSGAVYPLQGNQREAVDPRLNVWLSASAGTGKTQVLSARVLRLLLREGVDPSQILCLTFTKAGAAEMAVRINSVLARWVRLKDTELAKELGHLGADTGPESRERARTLFASVLDCPGGGLRIDTIHAFSQWLLANFPNEAELIPGSRPMEDRERELLSREVLGEMLTEAERIHDSATLDAVAEFTTRKDPDALRSWLMRCARQHRLWFGRTAWQPPMRGQVLQLLGLPSDADALWMADALSPEIFPDHQLRAMLPVLAGWNAKTGQESASFIEHWLTLETGARMDALGGFYDTVLKKDGTPRTMKKPSDEDPHFVARQQEVVEAVALVAERQTLLDLADFLAPALELGRKFALLWDEAKTREGLLDFDDLIERAAQLLTEKADADWIRYKLDRQFDHILVDEAQDTNEAQWNIILDGLIDDFFSGEGAAAGRLRTIFAVGDYKQAIFGFQGTSPENFEAAKLRVKAGIGNAAASDEVRRSGLTPQFGDLDLGQSFRTARSVLTFVDGAIAAIGPGAFGLKDEPSLHIGEERPGLVTLWEPVRDARGNDADSEAQDWLARHDRMLAEKIATQVQRWVKGGEPFALEKGRKRNASAGDIMVLVRKRRELAALIVARLHAKGVPVAGVDRLRLGAPLAVKDLVAALKFAAQPLDDLNLANLLASPLVGWSQEELLAFVPRGEKRRLWHHLRESDEPQVAHTVAKLRDLLAGADFETPEALLHWMLVGPWQGRQKLIARLGREANDPIDELVNAAFAYEAVHTPSLAGFIQWFEAGDSELKRDAGESSDLVRVMTVHGSKGLQAPIVILADAAGRPSEDGELSLREDEAIGQGREVPVPALRKEEIAGPLDARKQAAVAAELQEHWRLLYVAMTRAEEALFIGGSLGPRDAKGPHPDSWYARLAPLFGEDALEDDLWGARSEWGERSPPVREEAGTPPAEHGTLPDWARTPIGPEPRPPRPLAPSRAGEEQGADPPLPAGEVREAARRGVLIHRLLERLPELERDQRRAAAEAWLARQAHDLSENARADILARALQVLDHPDFAEVFSPAALAEVPLAAIVGGEVIAGTADRLLVTRDRVTVVDFKTARRPPTSAAAIPESVLKQMAAYVAALEAIYPGRAVRAAVLYTQTPEIFALSDAQVWTFKNAFQKS
ncbi:double-strand break repair helicase AddA [Altererythrobacter arenosus]|uniref:DNA 3'-5' helicase n=1 Tax=Altererythrobacter arenosus TaxID=3032592 RepID=A0ABY8FTX4_9SPHN|nr:double-strand break repair helicase AddA [Altererythrobacter sp. CAU 1644]WFL76846.1 double-strand break repair helicase AddA [Altererythrobacter sp. CAU 1644]